MIAVNMLQAKTTLSKLVEQLESGIEDEVIIARHGKPVARLTKVAATGALQRIGVAKGRFEVPDDIDADNELIARMFQGNTP